MKRMLQFGTAAVLAAGAMIVSVGCQNSGHQDDTSRGANASEMYDRAYVAARDTNYRTELGGPSHPLAQGTRAYFNGAPTSADWQRAKVEGTGVVYVHPADFTAENR